MYNNSHKPKKFAVVLNLSAGRGTVAREWGDLKQALKNHDINYEIITANSGQEALAKVMSLPKEVSLMAVGGDGTIRALLPAVLGTGRLLAIIPLGSGNDSASMLELKSGDFDEALSRLKHAPRLLDAIEVEYFKDKEEKVSEKQIILNGMGMGLDAQVNQNAARASKWLSGFQRYAWGAIVSMRNLKLMGIRIEVDDKLIYQGDSYLCAVMNGTRYGGGFTISPHSDVRDGKLNVIFGNPVSRGELPGLMLKILRKNHLDDPRVNSAVGSSAFVRWENPIAMHLDGDDFGNIYAARVKVLAGAITILNG